MGCFIKVPLEEVQTYKNGFVCMTNKWWLVEDGCVLGYKIYGEKSKLRPSPQCNPDKRLIEMVLKRNPEQTAVFLDVAYWWPDSDA